MFIVDSHCHLYYEPYIKDLQKTIDESKSKNVKRFLSISVDLKTSLKNIKISIAPPNQPKSLIINPKRSILSL